MNGREQLAESLAKPRSSRILRRYISLDDMDDTRGAATNGNASSNSELYDTNPVLQHVRKPRAFRVTS